MHNSLPYSTLMNTAGPLAAYGEYSPSKSDISPVLPHERGSQNLTYTPANHLADEANIFLRYHSADPVGWFPQGKISEAFQIAASTDKPVFVSVSYSTNHWCSVMGRDCWLDNEVADMMNDTVIPVLVDGEEVSDLAMLATILCRLQNGSSGFPVNMFMTPEGLPFFVTTWLPKRTMGQMTGITEILPRIRWLWTVQRDDVNRAAHELRSSLADYSSLISGAMYKSSSKIGSFTAFQALDDMRSIFDIRWGGFGSSPKYIEHDKILFLLKQAEDTSPSTKHDKSDALTMTDITLRRMWRGGIHDHLGGGFSHCSTDAQWLVPHFEKLLCDNALLLLEASMSQRIVQNSFHRLLAEDIIFCLTHYFADTDTHSQGFRTAVDGDTSEGEGRYYLWNEGEIRSLLPEDGGLFCAAYAVLPSGNFGSELAGSQMSWNVLYEASTVTELARRYALRGEEVASRLYQARKILLDYRDNRHPLKSDCKILMDWNGLAIGSLAHASVSFETKEWLDIAERTALFITRNLKDKSGRWFHSWMNGKLTVKAGLDDISYVLWGIVEIIRASQHFGAGEKQIAEWQDVAKNIADYMISTFHDEKFGGMFLTSEQVLPSLPRLKHALDYNMMPSGNALAAMSLSELAFILDDRKYSDISRGIIGCFARYVRENPLSCLTMITADLSFKTFKPAKKPEPEVKPVLTDEELNREETQELPETPQDERRSARQSRRGHQETQQGRNERTSRRTSRPHRNRER